MEPLVVWYFLGTEIPYPSSQTKITSGTCNTPAALTVSQNGPSEVDASPIVQKHTSLPLVERSVNCCSSVTSLNFFEARAKPSARGICPAVGAMSATIFFNLASGSHSPSSVTNRVAKCELIWRPPLKGSFSKRGSAYNCAKNC